MCCVCRLLCVSSVVCVVCCVCHLYNTVCIYTSDIVHSFDIVHTPLHIHTQYVWNTHPNTATVAISLIAAHFFVTAAVSTLLYHREFGLRLAFLSEHHPPSYNAVLPPPPVVQHLWTARCALLWGMAAWQGVFVVWTVMHV